MCIIPNVIHGYSSFISCIEPSISITLIFKAKTGNDKKTGVELNVFPAYTLISIVSSRM